jgi:hypothetical protein
MTTIRPFAWLSLLTLAACADAAGPTPPVPAPRLQPWALEIDGAPALAVGILDTKENVHCAFRLAADGALRCLPEAPGNLWPTSRFADPGCQTPIWNAGEAEGRELAASARPVTLPQTRLACEPQRFDVAVLEPLSVRHVSYVVGAAGCELDTSEQPVPTISTVDMIVARTIAPEAWVAGTQAEGAAVSPHAHMREIVTGDGARFATEIFDDRWQQPCTVGRAEIGIACWPTTISSGGGFYADATCTAEPLMWISACSRPAFIVTTFTELYALSEPWTGPIYHHGRVCTDWGQASSEPGRDHFAARGARLDEDALAIVQDAAAGTGRFRVRGLLNRAGAFTALPLGLRHDTPPLFDTTTNEGCVPTWTSDGPVRCVPESVHLSNLIGVDAPIPLDGFPQLTERNGVTGRSR